MATDAQQSLPIRDAPPAAGGGISSKTAETQAVANFTPLIQSYLKNIYEKSVKGQDVPHDNSSPPLAYFADFLAWYQSSASSAVAPPPRHDLSFPLSNYYISSSHNTYLSGNQIYGSATGEAYSNVLLRGCRCLEIDVWDGEEDTSSVSSSDLEEQGGKTHESEKHGDEGRRARANSRFSRLKEKVKDKATKVRSHSKSPAPRTHRDSAQNLPVEGDARAAYLSPGLSSSATVPGEVEPRVYHGYTLTKPTPFREVCHSIRDSAFVSSDLPIIVSLEVHCCMQQQEKMVEILKHVFHGYLIDISDDSESKINALPSPEHLRNKILIKVKWTPNTETGESNDPAYHAEAEDLSGAGGPNSNPDTKKKAAKILQGLSQLGVYTRAYKFSHFSQPEAKIATHVFSLSEAKVEDLHSDPQHGPAMFNHNRDYLVRVYPSGMRLDSSNVEPCFLWRQGAQMVALNWQKLDRGMMLNEGMFAGEAGWVLKPDGFRGNTTATITTSHSEAKAGQNLEPKRKLLDLDVRLVAAQNLPVPIGKDPGHAHKMRPYVKLQLHVDTHGPPGQAGSTGDVSSSSAESIAAKRSRYHPHLHRHESKSGSTKEYIEEVRAEQREEESRKLKRRSHTQKTADPDFENELISWRGIHDVVDELSFLRVKVEDDRMMGKDELMAWACVKLSRLREGYRILHLLDGDGRPSGGMLLIEVRKTLY